MFLNTEQVVELYQAGLSKKQIGDKLGCSRTPIDRLLKQAKVKIRTNAESISALNSTKTTKFNHHQEQLIYGSMLGDAGLYQHTFQSNKTERMITTLRLVFSHSTKQLSYLEHKKSIIGGCKIGTRKSAMGSTIKWFAFCHTPSLQPYAEVCLNKDDRKRVTKEWVDKLDWEGLAYWYMDDGALIIGNHGTLPILHFYTNSFSPEERQILTAKLREFGLDTREIKSPNPNPKERILVSRHKSEAITFMKQIRPWIIPSMAYKIRWLNGVSAVLPKTP